MSIPTFHQPYRLTFKLTDFDAVEFVGYIGRALSSKETPNWTLGPYIIQALLLLVAPALFAASIYMTLGRIILVVEGEQYSLIRKRFLTKIFVLGDVLSFFIQAAGIVVVFSLDQSHEADYRCRWRDNGQRIFQKSRQDTHHYRSFRPTRFLWLLLDSRLCFPRPNTQTPHDRLLILDYPMEATPACAVCLQYSHYDSVDLSCY